MSYCSNCGQKLEENAKFCSNCGAKINNGTINSDSKREIQYEGYMHKCPNCGEILKSFEINCPSCGYELRGASASNSVKEFATKLEQIESKRTAKKTKGLLSKAIQSQELTDVDIQKISLIKSFPVPNTKEDMLEFMILASSNMNMKTYDSYNTNKTKSEVEINEAWFSKVQQVYEKAKRSYSTDDIFTEINAIYENVERKIKKNKKRGILKWVLIFGWMPIVIVLALISDPGREEKEIERLENIVIDVQVAIDSKEWEHALRIADSIDYQRYDTEMERKWDIEREYWTDEVIEKAKNEGVILEYTPSADIDNANDDTSRSDDRGGFVDGFKEGLQSGNDEIQNNIDEFNEILSENTEQ